MKDVLISMFIDDELDLDEKIEFVAAVHDDSGFRDETVDLLRQEKLLRSRVAARLPGSDSFVKPTRRVFPWRPVAVISAGIAAALMMLLLYPTSEQRMSVPHRFIIFHPGVEWVELTGSFLDWKTLPMKPAGDSGYWELTIDVPEGEHRFSYILEGGTRLADPTVSTREHDDFGGENSILEVRSEA
jgi:hypothetical protein